MNIFNIPRHVTLFHSDDFLMNCQNIIDASKTEEYDNTVDDLDDFSLDSKDYFIMRYRAKKYGKIKYKNKTFKISNKHFVSRSI
jgi:hypothetical protein